MGDNFTNRISLHYSLKSRKNRHYSPHTQGISSNTLWYILKLPREGKQDFSIVAITAFAGYNFSIGCNFFHIHTSCQYFIINITF